MHRVHGDDASGNRAIRRERHEQGTAISLGNSRSQVGPALVAAASPQRPAAISIINQKDNVPVVIRAHSGVVRMSKKDKATSGASAGLLGIAALQNPNCKDGCKTWAEHLLAHGLQTLA
jgi:hypothetical protein